MTQQSLTPLRAQHFVSVATRSQYATTQQHGISWMIYLNMYMKRMMHIPPFMVRAEPWSA